MEDSFCNMIKRLAWAFPKHSSKIAGEVIRCSESKSFGDCTDGICTKLLLSFTIHQQILHLLKPNLFEQLDRGDPELFTTGFGN